MAHSNLPWNDYGENPNYRFVDSNPVENIATQVAELSGPSAHANAAYITRACNAYPALVAALRTLLNQPWRPYLESERGQHDLATAHAALKDAGEEV